jgi:hypothetical protein
MWQKPWHAVKQMWASCAIGWFTTSTREGEAHSEWNQQQIERIRQLEDKYRTANDERRVTGVR